jgi:hypothetical protein
MMGATGSPFPLGVIMVLNRNTLKLDESVECDNTDCSKKITDKGNKVGELIVCDDCKDKAEAMSWRTLPELGYTIFSSLARYYV